MFRMFIPSNTIVAAALMTIAVSAPAIEAGAQDAKVGAIEIHQPWTRATPTGAKVAGGFMTIKNTGSQPDRLIGGTFEKSARVEVHEMKIENDIMKMRELAGGLEIKAGQSVVLKPGSYHVMFMQLAEPLAKGTAVGGTLKFAKAGTVSVTYNVKAMGMKKGMKHGHASKGKQ